MEIYSVLYDFAGESLTITLDGPDGPTIHYNGPGGTVTRAGRDPEIVTDVNEEIYKDTGLLELATVAGGRAIDAERRAKLDAHRTEYQRRGFLADRVRIVPDGNGGTVEDPDADPKLDPNLSRSR